MALIPCAGAIIVDGDGRLLLIQRGKDPGRGLWSVPGGKCEPGETAAQACVREALEETGLTVEISRHAGQVRFPGLPGDEVLIDDFLCIVTGGTLQAGDDADAAQWVDLAAAQALPLTTGLLEALRGWGAWPTPAA
ncbi:MAG: hydrolase [Pseudonocardiales bacterium]|nr:hydrolase [Pseudonocardiales bacterium]